MFCCAGWILIDRCGKHFGTILNFLRDGTVPLPETRRELLELQKEAKYYLIEELVQTIEAQLVSQTQVDPICKVPLITSQKEEQALVGSTCKVREKYYYYTPFKWPLFQENLGKPAPERLTILDFNEARNDGVAVMSASPYANHLRLVLDKLALSTSSLSLFYRLTFLQSRCFS